MNARATNLPALTPRPAVCDLALWSVPVVVLLVCVAMPFNSGFYDLWINYDAQGNAQQYERIYTTRIFRYTSGVLCGQGLAFLAGVSLARRHAHAWALAVAVPLALLLALATFTVAYPFARHLDDSSFSTAPLADPVLVRTLVCTLAAYPLYAIAGVGLGVLVRSRRLLIPLLLLLFVGWCVATMAGLLQNSTFRAPAWLLWAMPPPMAAGASVALAGMSLDVWINPPELYGDWGRGANSALLLSAAAYAVGLNLLGGIAERRLRSYASESPSG